MNLIFDVFYVKNCWRLKQYKEVTNKKEKVDWEVGPFDSAEVTK